MSEAFQGLPALERIEEDWLDPALIEAVPVDWVRRNALVPFRRNGQVTIAGAETAALQAYEDLSLLLGVEAVWTVAPAAEIQRAIDRCYFRRAGQAGAAAAQAGQAAADEGAEAPVRREADDLLAGSADAPVSVMPSNFYIKPGETSFADLLKQLGNGLFIADVEGLHAGLDPVSGEFSLIAKGMLVEEGRFVRPIDQITVGGFVSLFGAMAMLLSPIKRLTKVNEQLQRGMAAAETILKESIAAISREHGVQCHLHGGFNRPPKPIDPAAEKLFNLVRDCGNDLGLALAWKATGGVCDGNNIAACGVPVVDTMGPRGGSIHSDKEFLIVDSLAERAQLSALTLMRLAEKGRV